MKDRVKYYSTNDLGVSYYLPKVKEILDDFIEDPNTTPSCVEDAIEFQNVVKFINANIFSIEWESEYIEKVKKTRGIIQKSTAKYLGMLSGEEILTSMDSLEHTYYDDFFENFKQFKYGDKISEIDFKQSFLSSNIPVRYLLKTSYFANAYSIFLRDCLLSDSLHIELLLWNYTEGNSDKLIFPENITKEDWSELVDSYIENADSSINYLGMLENPIKNLDATRYFNISPKQKLRIKERLKKFSKSIATENSGVVANMIVYTIRKQYEDELLEGKLNNEMSPKEAIERSILNNMIASTGASPSERFSYTLRGLIDSEQITEAHTFLDIFKYIRDEYDFFSSKVISKLPSYPNDEMGAVLKSLGIKTNNSYLYDMHFQTKQQMALQKIKVISKFIGEWHIRIENIIEWYFVNYCKEKYDISWIPFDLPHSDETVGNKTSTLFRIEENIRTQYVIFSEERMIDRNLVNETPTPSIEQLSSLLEKKYAYLSKKETAKNILYLLFSDQSSMCYIDKSLKGEDLTVLINSYDIRICDFNEYQKGALQYLIDNGIIEENNEFLRFTDITKIELLRDIYLFGVTSFIHASSKEKTALDELEKDNIIIFDKSLFTKQESDYLNFILNNKVFDNSLAIRNKYQHGVPYYENIEQYETDNVSALLVLVHYMIKIDDELDMFYRK
ncbi:hypothetical protein HCB26_04250 [Listeria booriae]|uniref:Uncharacterized protein n=1 Tax=Listeria booriae TaxID=1552123 RepID=A0A7X1D4K4_9LIST|nr:hypothetical protein [Listeria booriae]MBC2165771.1 hypothetical protein [Listeria booriae]